jgi:hypothetical protein
MGIPQISKSNHITLVLHYHFLPLSLSLSLSHDQEGNIGINGLESISKEG